MTAACIKCYDKYYKYITDNYIKHNLLCYSWKLNKLYAYHIPDKFTINDSPHFLGEHHVTQLPWKQWRGSLVTWIDVR